MQLKLFVALGLCLIGQLTAHGQNPTRFGITGGLNASQIQTSLSFTNLLWRYKVGVTLEKRFTRNVALASELVYTRQGSSLSSTNGYVTDKYITAFDYVSLPVLLRFRPKGERSFVEVGGQAGCLTSANGYHTSDKAQTFSPFQHTKKVDMGLVGGVGYRLSRHSIVDARYYYGLKPLQENYTANDPQTGILTYYRVEQWYNRVYSLNLNYYF